MWPLSRRVGSSPRRSGRSSFTRTCCVIPSRAFGAPSPRPAWHFRRHSSATAPRCSRNPITHSPRSASTNGATAAIGNVSSAYCPRSRPWPPPWDTQQRSPRNVGRARRRSAGLVVARDADHDRAARRNPARAVARAVLRRPVLIFESDDWGPGDATHVEALRRLCEILGRYRDAEGHHPVMTLGMVLALPDRERMRGENIYVVLSLADARYAELRSAIEEGVRRGVFAVQLHGKEHYWPPALMVAAQRDEIVRAWLESDTARTEDL